MKYLQKFNEVENKENWEKAKIKWDNIYNDESSGSIKWKENSKNIEKTMSIVSDEAKKYIEEYYNKHGKN